MSLPHELVDTIFTFCDTDTEDKPSLLACALISHSWLYSSRRYTFNKVVLSRETVVPFFSLLESPHESLSPHVSGIDFLAGAWLRWAGQAQCYSEANQLNALKTLRLFDAIVGRDALTKPQVTAPFKHITNLKLSRVLCLDVHVLLQFLVQFPLLSSLSLKSIFMNHTVADAGAINYRLENLRYMALGLEKLPMRCLLTILLSSNAELIPNLSELAIHKLHESNIELFRRLIQYLGKRNLKKLVISSPHPEIESVQSLISPAKLLISNLESLAVPSSSPSETLEWLAHLMDLPKLEFLTITFNYPFPHSPNSTSAGVNLVDQASDHDDAKLWNQIDEIVITRFPHLQNLRLVLNTEREKKAIPDKLPKSTSRGMVSLELCSRDSCSCED